MNLYPAGRLNIKKVQRFIITFYIVGIIGFLIPFTKNIFIIITPLALILCTYLLAVFHKNYSKKTILIFLLIYVLGFSIEVAGVNTGFIFGNYYYGNALGLKIFGTPLLIGLNWLFLTYTSTSVVRLFIKKNVIVIIMAPLLMIIYDLFLEQTAPRLDMWYWENSAVPLNNYIAWYFVAVVFVTLLTFFKIDTKNPMAAILFTCQLVFFILLFLMLQ